MKHTTIRHLLAAATALMLAAFPATAQNTAYAPGDLVLFFQKTGSTNTVYANIGNTATAFRGAAAGAADGVNRVDFLDIDSTLKSAFGDGWATDPTIYAGLAGVWGTSATNGVALQNGDPNRTLYISSSRLTPGTVGQPDSSQWDLTLAGNSAMTTAANGIQQQNNILETQYQGAVVVSPTSTSQIDDQNPFLSPGIQGNAMSNTLQGGIQQGGTATSFGTFGAAGNVQFALDLYRVLAITTAPGQVAGTQRLGSYEGTVTVNSAGKVSFIATALPAISVQQPAGTGLSNGGTRGFGNVAVGSSSDLTFTIGNTGDASLTGLGITIDGANAGEFSVVSNPAASVASGDTTTFSVRFAPSAKGNRTATLHIASNDSSNSPFDIALSGTGQAADISVQQPVATSIADGGSKDFGNVEIGSSKSLTFTIANNGNIDLTGLAITIDGANSGNFTITSSPTAPVSPGDTTTFTVRFTPNARGIRTAAIHIASNDPFKSPYDITLTGTGQAPDISVRQPAATTIPNGGSKAFGNANVGSTNSLVFTIANGGNIDLTDLALSIDGANASDFSVTANPVSPVSAGNTTTFTVEFTPSNRGSRTATLHIASNDPFKSPYDITLTGTGQAPDISVEQPAGTGISNGGSRGFGPVSVGSNNSLTFTIANGGDINLTGLSVTIDGANADDFTVTSTPAASVAPSATTTFTVRFAPAAAGSRTAALHIASNDPFKNPFNITLNGTGQAPDITVQQPVGTVIGDGKSVDFGNLSVGATKSLVFTIANEGNVDLTGLAITIDGPNAPEFKLTSKLSSPVTANNTTTFTVEFSPASAGVQTAALHIASNDPYKNPYDITLTGSADAADIDVQQPVGTSINDGGTKDFGDVVLGASVDLTFTLANNGSAALSGILLAIDGSSDFSIITKPAATVGIGGTSTFGVRFSPTRGGTRNATVHIASNDPNENPYDINLTGNGLAPDIIVEETGGTVVGDGGARTLGDVLVGSSKSMNFTIRNTGVGNLTGLVVSLGGAHASMFSISSNPTSPVAPSGSTTFSVAFNPTSAGVKTASVRIASNDPDESPYDIQLVGTGVTPQPEIVVQGAGGGNIADGAGFGLGNTTIGDAPAPKAFTIINTGDADLTGLSISIDGLQPTEFIITQPLLATLVSGASTTFTVAFNPAATGFRRASLHIASNDKDENPLDIQIFGNGVSAPASEIQILGPKLQNMADGGSTGNFGKTLVGGDGVSKTFTIRNRGKAALSGISITLSGASPGDFQIVGPSVTSLAQGADATFAVTFVPTEPGYRFARLHVLSNDADEASFDVQLIGIGVAPAAEIVIQQPIGTNRADGRSRITFDPVAVGMDGIAELLTIRNTGTADLTDLKVLTSGPNADDFVIGTFAKTTLAPGQSASFKITFKPRKPGTRNAVIHVLNNDSNENPYDIKLRGVATDP